MIRRYGNVLINLTTTPVIILDNKLIEFRLQSMGWILGDSQQTVRFESKEDATKEFETISSVLQNHYKDTKR